MCCLPVGHQETCVCPRGWTEAGAGGGGWTPHPHAETLGKLSYHTSSASVSTVVVRDLSQELQLLKDPRGLREGSHDLEAVGT